MLNFNVDQVPFEVVVAQQQLISQVYAMQMQMGQQPLQPSDPKSQPVQQQAAGGQ